MLPPTAWRCRTLTISVLAMAARTAARVVTFGVRDTMAAVLAGDIRLDDLGRASFRLLMPGGSADVALRLHGAHHVSNALAAAAIAAELGMDTQAIAAALSAATVRSRRRMEVRERPDGVLVVNDAYNANPDSTRAAIEALRHLARGGRRGFAVLGHMAELGDIADAARGGRQARRPGGRGRAGRGGRGGPPRTRRRAGGNRLARRSHRRAGRGGRGRGA